MNLADLAVGALLGFILGVLGNYVFEGWGLKARAARTSERRARRRATQLTRELDEVRSFHNDRSSLILIVVSRVLLVTLLWISQEVTDYFLGLVSNASSTYSLFSGNQEFRSDAVVTTTSTVGSILGILLLSLVLRLGLSTYRTVRRVTSFSSYEKEVETELANLQQTIHDYVSAGKNIAQG